MSGHYDPHDWCESPDELAREVLDPQEYAEWQATVAERARVRNLARQHRNERMRAVDIWADDYKGPTR